MLKLTRRVGESIVIDDNIRVVVLEVRGRQVFLGVEAPREVPVDREEVAEKKAREMQEAVMAR